MANNPKDFERKMIRVLNALKDLAPSKKFGSIGVEQLEPQVARSLAPRRRIIELDNETIEQFDLRDDEDRKTMQIIEKLVRYVVADEEYGPDSPLYEAFGYVRKSDRKSGLTRKKKAGGTETP